MPRFNFDEMLDLAGNTAVFLLYMHARIASINTKAMARTRDNGSATLGIDELKRSATLALAHDKEARPRSEPQQGVMVHAGVASACARAATP